MATRSIYVTRQDMQRLRQVIGSASNASDLDRQQREILSNELDRAIVVDEGKIPPDVIRMRTRVRVYDSQLGKRDEYTLVYPWEADVHLNLISVLAPLGTALLGYREGDRIEWQLPGGVRQIHVERIHQQADIARPQLRAAPELSLSSI